MIHPPTTEQLAILDLIRTTNSNIMINALAGTGKTTTLELIEAASPVKPVLYLVFNTKNAKDAETRMASTTTVRTFNSLGHRIWAKTTRPFKPNPKKIPDLLRLHIDEAKSRGAKSALWDNFWQIIQGVNSARSIGFIPMNHIYAERSLATEEDLWTTMEEQVDDFTRRTILALLSKSIATAYDGLCDFNDQIYMPTLFGGTFPQFPLTMVDEYQDLNAINHKMVERLVRNVSGSDSRRLIGVGDPHQSIYAFRGAVAGGMGSAAQQHNMSETDLSISFRCPEAIVRSVQWRVPHFKWIKPGGEVQVLRRLTPQDIPEEATFICRNNAPLFKLAMKLLNHGRSVSVVGSDIGSRMLGQMKKLGDSSMTQSQTLDAINAWLESKLAKGSKTAHDTAECMRVFAEHGPTLSAAIAYAEHLFAQRGQIVFTTGHKAKGLEWPTVYVLDSWLCDDIEQDQNLAYVMATRAMEKLFYVNSIDIRF